MHSLIDRLVVPVSSCSRDNSSSAFESPLFLPGCKWFILQLLETSTRRFRFRHGNLMSGCFELRRRLLSIIYTIINVNLLSNRNSVSPFIMLLPSSDVKTKWSHSQTTLETTQRNDIQPLENKHPNWQIKVGNGADSIKHVVHLTFTNGLGRGHRE